MSLKVTQKCTSVISPYVLADGVLFQGLIIMVGLIYEAGAAYQSTADVRVWEGLGLGGPRR